MTPCSAGRAHKLAINQGNEIDDAGKDADGRLPSCAHCSHQSHAQSAKQAQESHAAPVRDIGHDRQRELPMQDLSVSLSSFKR